MPFLLCCMRKLYLVAYLASLPVLRQSLLGCHGSQPFLFFSGSRSQTCVCGYAQTIMKEKVLSLRGIVGIYPANSVGDDIRIFTDESRAEVAASFYGLRQQAEKDNDEPYMCISDFIAPEASGVPDYLGLFANGCFGVETMIQPFKQQVRPMH